MGFKLRSGNKPNFRNIGSTQKRVAPRKSHSPLRQIVDKDTGEKVYDTPTTEEWNEGQKNKSTVPGLEKGRTIIEKDLASIFEKNRIKKIDVNNKKFDPNFHQAMSEVEDDKADPGTILHEIQAGYLLGERLLRPALVSVSKKKSSKDQENKDKKEEK